MSDLIKNLALKASWLLLILSSHFGLLGLISGYDWIKHFYSLYATSLLLSALVLSVAYIASFSFSRALNRKLYFLLLQSVIAISVILLWYKAFSVEIILQKVFVSTVLFLAVIALMAFLDFRKENIIWKNIYRILRATVLVTGLTFICLHYVLIIHPKTPLANLDEGKFRVEKRLINTAFHNVHLTKYYMGGYHLPLVVKYIPQYISSLDDKNFLLVNSLGEIYYLALKKDAENNSSEEDFYVRRLSATFPINHEQFESFRISNNIPKLFFRASDIYTDVESGRLALYIGHHFWNKEEKCFTLRISKLMGDALLLLEDKSPPKWRTLYETSPCFSLSKVGRGFAGNQVGGRIVGLDENNLLFSVGDHGVDGVNSPENFPQNTTGSYGKIWKINRNTGEADLVSLGHRNPQGLYRAPDGAIWETEHGPQGGDELNKIKPGKNYGWAHVVYGTNYGKFAWPLNANQDEHEGYEQPVFVWTPSIAVSNLIRVEGDLFPIWKNDLLVGSLKNQTLYRLQMHEDRVIYSEPIKIGERIRDLAETSNGEIFIWTDSQNMIRLRPADSLPREGETIAETGERLFYKCAGCHNTGPNVPHGIGPNLRKVYKSRIARHVEYNYSPALQARSAERWTRENLDLFLQDPESFAPGTVMQMKVPDDHERRALLHYLENN